MNEYPHNTKEKMRNAKLFTFLRLLTSLQFRTPPSSSLLGESPTLAHRDWSAHRSCPATFSRNKHQFSNTMPSQPVLSKEGIFLTVMISAQLLCPLVIASSNTMENKGHMPSHYVLGPQWCIRNEAQHRANCSHWPPLNQGQTSGNGFETIWNHFSVCFFLPFTLCPRAHLW